VFFSSQRKFRHHHNYYSCFVFSLYWPSTRTHMKLNIIILTYLLYHSERCVGLPVPNIDLLSINFCYLTFLWKVYEATCNYYTSPNQRISELLLLLWKYAWYSIPLTIIAGNLSECIIIIIYKLLSHWMAVRQICHRRRW